MISSNEQDANLPRISNSEYQNNIIRVKPMTAKQMMPFNNSVERENGNNSDTNKSISNDSNKSDVSMRVNFLYKIFDLRNFLIIIFHIESQIAFDSNQNRR